MHLYMYSEFSKEVANITLRDGCSPCIGDQVSEQLEPALWFKVLILDAISIDCNKRVVLWHTSTDLQALKSYDGNHGNNNNSRGSVIHESLPHFSDAAVRRASSRRVVKRKLSESVFTGGECLGYSSDMDEVFDFTQDALSKFASGEISQTAFNKEIFRILHLHILPNISLSADDVINVQDAAAIVDSFVSDMDELILAKQNKIDRVHQDMAKQRRRFVDDISDPEYDFSSLSMPMAELLQRQMNEDLSTAQQHLEELTRQVEVVKETLHNNSHESSSSSSSSGEEDLSRIRHKRNSFLSDEFNKLLTARAVLDDHVRTCRDQEPNMDLGKLKQKSTKSKKSKSESSKDSKKKKKKSRGYSPAEEADPLHATYMGMQQTSEELIEEIQSMAHRKVLQISVKETIRSVLQTLLSGQETSGADINSTGTQRSTDVMRHSRIPMEWLSLAEQVAAVIKDDKVEISKIHRKFCEDVLQVCCVALQEKQLSDLSESIEQTSSPRLSPTRCGGLYAENRLYGLSHDASERSSGFSSSFQSESDASRSSNLSRSGHFNTRQISQSSCENPDSDGNENTSSSDLVPKTVRLNVSDSSLDQSLETSTDSSLSKDSSSLLGHKSAVTILETGDAVLVEQTFESDIEQTIDKLKSYIMLQFEEICEKLQNHLGYTGDMYFKKIWQCYENHFFAETLGKLSQLYEEAYSLKSQFVLDNVHSLTASDLDLSGFIVSTLKDIPLEFPRTFRDSLAAESTPSGTLEPESCSSDDPTSTLSDRSGQESPVSVESPAIPDQPDTNSRPQRPKSFASKGTKQSLNSISPPIATARLSGTEESSSTSSSCSSEQSLSSKSSEEDDPVSPVSIKISLPTATTLIYDRHTWPTLSDEGGAEQVTECNNNDDDMTADSVPSLLSPTILARGKTTQFQPDVKRGFSSAFDTIDEALKDSSPLVKLQQLMKSLKEIDSQYQALQTKYVGKSIGACADELIDILVLFLCNCDLQTAHRLHAHIMMLSHFLPRFFEGGPFSFTLVQFSAAFQVLSDRLLLKTKKLALESDV